MSLDPMGPHGPVHWFKVYRNCQDIDTMIYENRDENRDWFYWCFAMLHDCKRTSEQADPAHGIEAAKMVPNDKSQFNISLARAIKLHQMGQTMDETAPLGDMRIGICWDADRLELVRVGIMPDPKYMSTDIGKQIVENMNKPPAGYDHKSDWPGGPK